MTEHMARRLPDGSFTAHHDPAVAGHFTAHPLDSEQWERYDALEAETLVLRGETSAVLTRETAAAMARRGPRPRVVEIPGCGHAPALNRPEQIEIVARFLRA